MLDSLRDEVDALGYSVKEWASAARLPWQTVYKRLSNPKATRLLEYEQLVKGVKRLKAKQAKK